VTKLENARNFANKLWNATRFVVSSRPSTIPADATRRLPDPADLGPAERWIRSRASATVAAVDAAMADYAFAEVTRVLYDAIWNEFCDWGLEFAKVHLADESLSTATREATWWTLVEALDTYLRLLHPVMPFVTEALWAAIPHRPADPELLIVARWPAPSGRDERIEAEVGSLLELIRGLRNARAAAGVEARAWLETEIAVPQPMGATFEALRPAVERLARAKPIERRLTREALHEDRPGRPPGALTVIVGDLEAVAHRAVAADDASHELERARLERELDAARGYLDAARARLADRAFIEKAPPAIVDGARAREAELAEQVARLEDRLRG
jgi:valyl-tRNA synthetase